MARARKKNAPNRRERDHAVEYRRRVARAEKLARATGTPFSLSAARGHPKRGKEPSVSELRRLAAEIAERVRQEKREVAFQRLQRVLDRAGIEPVLPTLRVGVGVMTDRQLEETARITMVELRQKARRSPKIYDAMMGIEWNPYWYH